MDEDFISQIPIIQSIINDLWIISQIAPWFEADDVIASFVNHYKNPDLSMYIYSADKDLKQLLDDWVFIVDPVKEDILIPTIVRTRFLRNLKIGVAQDSIHDSESGCSIIVWISKS